VHLAAVAARAHTQGASALTARDVLGRTPLHYAAAKGAREMAIELLGIGLKVRLRSGTWWVRGSLAFV
jgi:ankyrin repeat protein